MESKGMKAPPALNMKRQVAPLPLLKKRFDDSQSSLVVLTHGIVVGESTESIRIYDDHLDSFGVLVVKV